MKRLDIDALVTLYQSKEYVDILPRPVAKQCERGLQGLIGKYDAEIMWVYANFYLGTFDTRELAMEHANKECAKIIKRMLKVGELSLENFKFAEP